MKNLFSIILAGGSGTRLWPLSREELPKQYLKLQGNGSMLQETLKRVLRVSDNAHVRIVTGRKSGALSFYQAKQVLSLEKKNVIEEPLAKNTAPAIALAMADLLKNGGANGDDLAFVCPSDHIVKDESAFVAAVQKACEAARQGYLVVFGVRPGSPETGFGYILRGEEKDGFALVERFVEKPDAQTAALYLEERNYFWNGGMFLFRIQEMLDALLELAPEIGEPASRGYEALLESFECLPSVSIDYAIMEKTSKAAMVTLDAGWSDVGSWDALFHIREKDGDGNVLSGDVLSLDSKNSLLFSEDRLVVGVDVENLIVVEGSDALFVAPRGSSQKVREIVATLKSRKRKEAVEVVESVRPWGRYRVIFNGERFKIKHIVVNPGERLSLQYHLHRSEHWVVVRGTAIVAVNESEMFVHEGESTFIPKSTPHRLENRGKIPLELIEVQIGEYLGEDDIVRMQDDYDR